jgi:hypothetical protein
MVHVIAGALGRLFRYVAIVYWNWRLRPRPEATP